MAPDRASDGESGAAPEALVRNGQLLAISLVLLLVGALLLALDGAWIPVLCLLSYLTAYASATVLKAHRLGIGRFRSRAVPLAAILLGVTAAIIASAFVLADDWRSRIVVATFALSTSLVCVAIARHGRPWSRTV